MSSKNASIGFYASFTDLTFATVFKGIIKISFEKLTQQV
jgi:hypothetical protein